MDGVVVNQDDAIYQIPAAFVYESGIYPTLRSSAHDPKKRPEEETGTTWLPDDGAERWTSQSLIGQKSEPGKRITLLCRNYQVSLVLRSTYCSKKQQVD